MAYTSTNGESVYVGLCAIHQAFHRPVSVPFRLSRSCTDIAGSEDKIEQGVLATALDATCIAWKVRFQHDLIATLISCIQDYFDVPYMHCGCPEPDPVTTGGISQRLSRLRRVIYKRPATAGSLNPSDRPDALAVTHVSDHNCVEPSPAIAQAGRGQRRLVVQERRKRDARLVAEGKMNKEVYARGMGHEDSFLCAAPAHERPEISIATSGGK